MPPPDPKMASLLDPIHALAGLTPPERQALLDVSTAHIHKPGAVIFQEGEFSKEVLFIAIGAVKIVKATPARRIIIRIIGPGEPIGLVAAFESRPYPASAVALIPSTILHVPERDFFSLLDRHAEIVRQLLRIVMNRQVDLGGRLTELSGAIENRIARVFLDLAHASDAAGDGPVEIRLPLTRQDIADLAGTTMETAIRILSRWGKVGVVLSLGDGFRIPSLHALKVLGDK